jgi:hypothetical protein
MRTPGSALNPLRRLAQNKSAHRCLHSLFPAALIATPQIFALWVPRHAARSPLRNNAIVLQLAFLQFNAHSAGAIEAV